jgi:magnesium transporter
VVYVGLKGVSELKIDLVRYNEEQFEESSFSTIEPYLKELEPSMVNWFSFNGLNRVKEIGTVGRHFGINVLDVEDIVNTAQRPSLNVTDKYLVLIIKMMRFDGDLVLRREHISLVLFKGALLLFHESDRDEFPSIRNRIESKKGRIRSRGADYLLFAILDSAVDNYFHLMESMTDKVESIEDKIFEGKEQEVVTNEIQNLKREILRIRKAVTPLMEITNRFERVHTDLISKETRDLMKDLHEHVAQVMESVEMNREMIWGLMDMHMSLLSNKMNEVMKVLTIISTIFIPLSFIAGVYGMNFEYIPELKFRYAYFLLLGIMVLIIVGMLFYFRRKKWL